MVANQRYDSATKFDKSFYIKGDFEATYNYFKSLMNDLKYNLLNNNCMQTTVNGLCQGKLEKNNKSKYYWFRIAKNLIIPNKAYHYLKAYLS